MMKLLRTAAVALLCAGLLGACANRPQAPESEMPAPSVAPVQLGTRVSSAPEESSSEPAAPPALEVALGDQYHEIQPGEAAPPAFQVNAPDYLPKVPGAAEAHVTVYREDSLVFEGTPAELLQFTPNRNGAYRYEVLLPESGEEYTYRFEAEVRFPPAVTVSGEGTAALGETLTLYIDYAEGLEVSAQTELSHPPAFYDVGGRKMALLPVSYYTKPGVYSLNLTVGAESFHLEIQANSRDFVVQNLTVDEDTTNDTIDNDFAIREWNEKIEPLKYITDPQQYWSGPFLMPVQGRTTTEFGTIRYTNGSTNASRHGALDIAAPTGTPVPAANAGRVIFAQYIQMSGNVVVIEHGLGLKTWYFHMDEIDVEEGAMVKQGEIIGKVGATGFVTGPHLHYGMSVNEVYINPQTATDQGIG